MLDQQTACHTGSGYLSAPTGGFKVFAAFDVLIFLMLQNPPSDFLSPRKNLYQDSRAFIVKTERIVDGMTFAPAPSVPIV